MNQLEPHVERQIRAMNFACEVHASQKYGPYPYVRHLAHVEQVLRRFGFEYEWDLMEAVWLHDSLEDTSVTWKQLDETFGEVVAMLVFAVTDGEGKNRRERKEASYAKMRDLPRAIILKLADRIANVESSLAGNRELLGMYAKEHESFRSHLHAISPNETNVMWGYLNGLLAPDTQATA